MLNGFLPALESLTISSRGPWECLFEEIAGGAQLEPGATLEFEPEQELTRGVWNALPEDLEAQAGQNSQHAQQAQRKRRILDRAKGATATTKGIQKSGLTPGTFFENPVAWCIYGRCKTTSQAKISFQYPRKQHS